MEKKADEEQAKKGERAKMQAKKGRSDNGTIVQVLVSIVVGKVM